VPGTRALQNGSGVRVPPGAREIFDKQVKWLYFNEERDKNVMFNPGKSDKSEGLKMKSHDVQKADLCGAAVATGILGLLISIFPLAYAIEAISRERMGIIPLIVFWIVMMIGVIIDMLRKGRKGAGGLIAVVGGLCFFLFLLVHLLWLNGAKGGEFVASVSGFPLFGSGILFMVCGKKQKKSEASGQT
jgi:hypothetical protein